MCHNIYIVPFVLININLMSQVIYLTAKSKRRKPRGKFRLWEKKQQPLFEKWQRYDANTLAGAIEFILQIILEYWKLFAQLRTRSDMLNACRGSNGAFI